MATTYFLSEGTSNLTNAPASEQSTAMPSGSNNSLAWALRDLASANTATATPLSIDTLGQTNTQSTYWRTFVGPQLATQSNI